MPDTRRETMEVQEAFDRLQTSETGLSSEESHNRLAELGPNVLAEKSKHSGIRTVMITGDHGITAVAVARQRGIGSGRDKVLEGRQIEEMTDEQLFNSVKTISVYARVAPVHKLRIVQQLIRQGEVVAVTGDSVNDALL